MHAILTHEHGKTKIYIKILRPQKDSFVLVLDEYGRLVGSENKEFLPILKVKSKAGKTYVLDLRLLYFSDLGTLTENLRHDNFPTIMLRENNSPIEYEYQFRYVTPLQKSENTQEKNVEHYVVPPL